MPTPDCRVRPIDAASVDVLDLACLDGDGCFRDSALPEDIIHDNTRKAGFAAAALVEYARRTSGQRQEPRTLINDLIADVHHLADGLGIGMTTAYRTAHDYYCAERRGRP